MGHKTVRKVEIRVSRVRVAEPGEPYGVQLRGPDAAAEIARRLIGNEGQEVFLAFLLDIRNRITGYVEVARGGVDSCGVDPKVVFRAAVLEGAPGVIVAHNHPSGDPEPSPEDDLLTVRLVQGGALLGVSVLDHVVVADGAHYSYAEHGRLTNDKDLSKVLKRVA